MKYREEIYRERYLSAVLHKTMSFKNGSQNIGK